MTFAFTRLLLATEHTEFDVGAERVALALARRHGLPLAAVLPIVSNVEYESVAPGAVARVEADDDRRRGRLEPGTHVPSMDIQLHQPQIHKPAYWDERPRMVAEFVPVCGVEARQVVGGRAVVAGAAEQLLQRGRGARLVEQAGRVAHTCHSFLRASAACSTSFRAA